MAVVSDPSGTPTIVYRAGDMTIDTLTAGSSHPALCTVYITRYCPYTVVTVTGVLDDLAHGCVLLPANPVVGDVVEAHADAGDDTAYSGILPPTGYTIENGASLGVDYFHVVLRLTSETNWTIVSSRSTYV